MTVLRPTIGLTMVAIATVLGIIGTGLLFTAFTDHVWGALALGLPLTLAGLYWSGRALAQGQYSARQRRLRRLRQPQSGR